jgi:hypothetical protein
VIILHTSISISTERFENLRDFVSFLPFISLEIDNTEQITKINYIKVHKKYTKINKNTIILEVSNEQELNLFF